MKEHKIATYNNMYSKDISHVESVDEGNSNVLCLGDWESLRVQ